MNQTAEVSGLKSLPDRCGRNRPAGMTLVEMLVVMAIVVLIAAVSIGALILLPEHAKARGTEALVSKIEGKLAERLSEFNRRRESIRTLPCDLFVAGNDPNRARVVAVIRGLRQELPEWFELQSSRATDTYDNDGDGLVDSFDPDEIIAGQWNSVDVTGDGNPDQASRDLPPSAVAILKYFERVYSENSLFSTLHRPVTARAETLYAVATAGGTDTEWIVAGETADTDEDGLLEFVDRWGNPIQFFLFPTHYTSPLQKPGQEINSNDPHQLLTQDDWYWNPPPSIPNPRRQTFELLFHSVSNAALNGPQAYRTHPLIISAGPDKGFGLETNTADVGQDRVMGTFDDTGPMFREARRITSPSQDGYGMDSDNIDNHGLRPH